MTAHKERDAPGSAPGWWMMPGPTLCPYCEQPHHVEAMLYCVECDTNVCAVCVIVSFDSDPVCPVCHGTSGDG